METMVSVLVPVYNREAEIEKCILSIVNQTYRNLEIILVDDGSTDNSLEICQKYAAVDGRIKVIHKENGGLISARKAGVQAAAGEYVAHIDGDDWVEAEYIETLVNASDLGTVDVVIAGFVCEYVDGRTEEVCNARPCGLYNKEEMKKSIYPVLMNGNADGYNEIYPSQWSKLFRRTLALEKQMMVDNEQKCDCDEDTVCVYPILLSANSIRIIDACQYHYVRRIDSLSTYGTAAATYFDAVKYMYHRLKDEFLQYEEKDILMLQLEGILSTRIATGLKRYYSFLTNQYLFPYELIGQGSRIVLYGAGAVGRNFYKQILKNHYCEVILWVDKGYERIDIPYAEIKNPEIMLRGGYDYVVVCLKGRQLAERVINSLKDMGISEDKIIWKEDYKIDLDVRFVE